MPHPPQSAAGGPRPLSDAERRYAWELFVESVDLERVRIHRDSLLSTGPPKVLGNTIHIPSHFGSQRLFEDSGALSPAGRRVLIHELGHVWQYQHGGLAYIGDSLWAQLFAMVKGEGRGGAYAWQRAARAGLAFKDWNPEQQAAAIEHYDVCRRRVGAGEGSKNDHRIVCALLPTIERMRRGEGATRFSRPGAAVAGLALALLTLAPVSLLWGAAPGVGVALLAAAAGVRLGGGSWPKRDRPT